MYHKLQVVEMRFNFINTPLPPYETIEKMKRKIKEELEKTIYEVTAMPKGSLEIMPGINVGCWDLIVPIFLTNLQYLGAIASILSLPQSIAYLYKRCEETLKKFTGGRNTATDFPEYIKVNLGIYDSIKYCIEKITEEKRFLRHAFEILVKDIIILCKHEVRNTKEEIISCIDTIKSIDVTTALINLGIDFDKVQARVISYCLVHNITV